MQVLHYQGIAYEAEAQSQVADEWLTDLLWASEMLEGILLERDGAQPLDRAQLLVMSSFFLSHLHSPAVQGRIAAWAAERSRGDVSD